MDVDAASVADVLPAVDADAPPEELGCCAVQAANNAAQLKAARQPPSHVRIVTLIKIYPFFVFVPAAGIVFLIFSVYNRQQKR